MLRTARVCDSCLCRRARWFCAADDAFLCQSCDVSVHSANQLARRHDRVRLETASFKPTSAAPTRSHLPPWMKGFTRKARTPRPNKQSAAKSSSSSVFSLVPEIGSDEGFLDDDDENSQFLQQHHEVPVFDPFDDDQKKLLLDELDDFADGFLPSEVDLADFVADVESLLEIQQEDQEGARSGVLKVKYEEQEELQENNNGEKSEDQKALTMVENEEKALKSEHEQEMKKKKSMTLRLNYDAVITAWDGQSSPYTTGNRPEFDLNNCWGEWAGFVGLESGERGMVSRGGAEGRNDEEREARVSRYREKRRTRLFSKKIRYQVRKLNAEKRPRMRGRFVKRTAAAAAAFMASNPYI